MPDLNLIIGNKNYSSWSLRAWLALRMAGLAFDEIVIPLDQPDTAARIREYSLAGRVPVLRHGDRSIWDSLAICEYAAELAPDAGLWPEDRTARAVARAVSAEMHSGFAALRGALPMNIRADRPGVPISDDTRADIDRVCRIWGDCRQEFGKDGPFLFGPFCIADAMFVPVAARFRGYGIKVDETARDYIEAVLSLPAMQEWSAAAMAEPWILESEEIGAG
ncbi:MAG: glutathione S-transferase family protein [Alphaproteobacteria bacterium]|nr:glutathione S-transferase family protein [Alphaproteobacteria bacterium]